MQPAYIYYTDGAGDASGTAPKSIFTQRSTIVKSGMFQRKFKTDDCPACRKCGVKKNDGSQGKSVPEHACQLKSMQSIEPNSSIVNRKLNENSENIKKNQNSINYVVTGSEQVSNNIAINVQKPFVVDSFASRRDIIPVSKLPPGGLSYFGNLPSSECTYTGPSSVFLNEERLSKFASLLVIPHEMERLLEIDSTTTTRLQKYSNFICPCGYICDIMGKDNHQKNCYLSITTDTLRLSNYQSLMPKMCANIELDKLPNPECTEKNEQKSSDKAAACAMGRTIYFGIETGEKCGRVTKDFVDSNKRHKFKLKAYKCPFCTFWCIDVLRFSTHISMHEPQKAFGCSACEYRSDRNFGVTRHIQLHKWKDILHKDAVCLSGNALRQNRYAQYKAYIVVTNRPLKYNDLNNEE